MRARSALHPSGKAACVSCVLVERTNAERRAGTAKCRFAGEKVVFCYWITGCVSDLLRTLKDHQDKHVPTPGG
eukprot:7200896-Prymnesium_polylepis.1